MFITRMALPRRTFLRGVGATLALPLLDAMVPALTAQARTAANPVRRFACAYMGNGANMAHWTPTGEGAGFALSPILTPLASLRDRLVVVSGLDIPSADSQNDGAGSHPRTSTAFLSGAHAKPGSVVNAGTTMDQILAKELGANTRLPSLEIAMDRFDQVGSCAPGYSCVYQNTISWRTPTMPMPMEMNPRLVFETLYGDGDTAEERALRIQEERSILDMVTAQVAHLRTTLGARDRQKLGEYFDSLRDVERRIEAAEQQNARLPVRHQPAAVPDTFKEYALLMFDLQVLAFQADITRVVTFMMTRENGGRTYPEIGIADGHHSISHHQNDPGKLAQYAKLNAYHVEVLANFLGRLQSTPDGDGTLLDHSIVLFGSGMSNGNAHSHRDVPVLIAGGGGGRVKGGRHLKYPSGTQRVSNLLLTLLDKLGAPVDSLGDSTGKLELLSDV